MLRKEKGARGRSHGVCCRFRARRHHVESLRRLAAVVCSSISLLQERYSALALGWQGNARVSPYRAQAPERIVCVGAWTSRAPPITSGMTEMDHSEEQGGGKTESHDCWRTVMDDAYSGGFVSGR